MNQQINQKNRKYIARIMQFSHSYSKIINEEGIHLKNSFEIFNHKIKNIESNKYLYLKTNLSNFSRIVRELDFQNNKGIKQFILYSSKFLNYEYAYLNNNFTVFSERINNTDKNIIFDLKMNFSNYYNFLLKIEMQINLEANESLIQYSKRVVELKQKGLWRKTKFCMFDALQYKSKEEIHTNFIFWLLKPDETHGIGNTFLKEVIKMVFKKDIDFEGMQNPKKEKDLGNKGRIDIEIVGQKWLFAIENKIYSPESKDQTNEYWKYYLEYAKDKGIPVNGIFLIYLSPSGYQPNSPFRAVSYKQIRRILEKVRSKIDTTAKDFIDSFINHIFYNLEN